MPKGVYDRSKSKPRKKHSKETLEKMSRARKDYYSKMSYEEKQEKLKNFISVGRVNAIGRIVSDETRAKLSKLQTGRVKTKEEREKLSKSLKGNIPWNKGVKRTDIEKQHIREGMKRYYESNSICRIWDNPTSIEVKIAEQLQEYGIKFIYQKPICGGHFILDFWLPDYQLVIECNGDYWHNMPERKARDKELEEYVFSKGKDILWLWEHEINDDWFDLADYLEVY